MKTISAIAALGLCLISACSTTSTVPVGMKVGQFVHYQCDAGKRLQARLATDGSTVRVRFEGGYELDRTADTVFEGEGFKLNGSTDMLELTHHGKPAASNCKPT